MERTIEIQSNQDLLQTLDYFIRNNLIKLELDSILKSSELSLLKLIKIINGDQEQNYNNYERSLKELTNYKKSKLFIKRYCIYTMLLAMKIVSKNNIPNNAYTKGVYEENRVAGKFKIITSMSVSTNLEEKPWVDLHLFSNIEPSITYTKIEPFQNQDLSKFDFHTCLVNKYTYALGKGGDFICGGCGYQQDFINNTKPTNDIYNNLAKWTDSLMSPFELEKYLNLVFEKIA